jgi:hypothetical protein
MGWDGTKNGALLRRASGDFDVLPTVDSNLEFQQDTRSLPIIAVVLAALSNDVNVLRPMMPAVREALAAIEPGRLYRFGPP